MNLLLFCEIALYTFFAIGGGAGVTVVSELMYKTKVPDLNHKTVDFKKPWYLTILMFIAFIPVFVPLWVYHFRVAHAKKKAGESEYSLMNENTDGKKGRDWGWVKISSLALCNLVMKVVSNVGLLWLPASIWQMLRGSSLIFTAILTVTYRKRKLFRFEWIGITIVIIALIVLGAQALLQGQGDRDALATVPVYLILLGVVLTILSQGIEAIKAILIEKFMKDSNIHSLATVAWQGFWGILMMYVFLPVIYYLPGPEGQGIHEDSITTVFEVVHSVPLIVYTVAYVVCQFFCNVYASYLITVTSALTRIVLEQFRALMVWVVFLFVYYVISKDFGEEWTWWSFMELGGFLLMFVGVLIYAGAIKHPLIIGPAYLEKEKKEEEEKAMNNQETINALSSDYQGVGLLSDAV